MHAAVRSGIADIEQFDGMSDYAKAMLVEYWRVRDTMTAFEQQMELDAIEKTRKG